MTFTRLVRIASVAMALVGARLLRRRTSRDRGHGVWESANAIVDAEGSAPPRD